MKKRLITLLALVLFGWLPAQTVEDHLRTGRALTNMQEYAQAIAQYNAALELAPQSAEAHYYRGMIYCQLGDFLRCSQGLAQAERIDPVWVRTQRKKRPLADTLNMPGLVPTL